MFSVLFLELLYNFSKPTKDVSGRLIQYLSLSLSPCLSVSLNVPFPLWQDCHFSHTFCFKFVVYSGYSVTANMLAYTGHKLAIFLCAGGYKRGHVSWDYTFHIWTAIQWEIEVERTLSTLILSSCEAFKAPALVPKLRVHISLIKLIGPQKSKIIDSV